MRSSDVKEAEFVGTRCVIGLGDLHRISGIAEVDEVHALDDPAVLHVEAGDEPRLEHQRTPRRRPSATGTLMRPS